MFGFFFLFRLLDFRTQRYPIVGNIAKSERYNHEFEFPCILELVACFAFICLISNVMF